MNFFYKVTLSIFWKKYSTQNIFSIDIQEFSKKKKKLQKEKHENTKHGKQKENRTRSSSVHGTIVTLGEGFFIRYWSASDML